MYLKYSNHVKIYISHLLNHIVHLIIEFRFSCFYMIHHTVIVENKNVETGFYNLTHLTLQFNSTSSNPGN